MGISIQAKVQADLIKLFEFAPSLLKAIKWARNRLYLELSLIQEWSKTLLASGIKAYHSRSNQQWLDMFTESIIQLK